MIAQSGAHEHQRRDRLHPNLLISSLQLLNWAMFQPSTWRAYIANIDPALRPDCTFVDLRPEHWRSPQLRRLFAGYAVYAPAIFLASALILILFGFNGEKLATGLLAAPAIMLLYLVLGGTWISIAVGLAMSVPGSLCFVLGYALVDGLGYPLKMSTVPPLYGPVYGLTIGLGGGMAALVADNLLSGAADELPSRFSIKLGGASIGVLLGAAINFAMNSFMRFAVQATFINQEVPGREEQNLWLASLLLIPALLIFTALVGTRRAWEVLRVTGVVLLCILGMFFLFARIDFLSGTTIGFTVTFIALMGIPYTVVERIAGPRVAASTTALGLGIGWNAWQTTAYHWDTWPQVPITLGALIVGAGFTWWGPVLVHPLLELWNLVIIRIDERRTPERPSLLHWHSAFWFDAHRLPLRTLAYLVTITERRPLVGLAALEELSTSRYHRWAVQSAQIELYARQLERMANIEMIASAAAGLASGELDSPVSGLLRSFSRIGQSVQAALNGASIYHKRLALSAVEERLDALIREMTISTDLYTVRFRPIAIRWRQILADAIIGLAAAATSAQEIENPYIFSLPLTEYQELFVGRTDIAARIEQLLVDRRRPPLLLYGQRRMGKTSLLRNLSRLLPSTTTLLFVDGEGISGAADYPDLLYAIAAAMVRSADQHRRLSLPSLERGALADSPFTAFNEWLDQIERVMDETQSVALLALDEFEALDSLSGKDRRFDATDMLRLLRNLIQHRPLFKVLLAGSHTLEEFRPWASQLINVQVVKMSYLDEADVFELIEHPMSEFPLRYEPAARRAIFQLTRGHPHLVQLLCYEIVELKNYHTPDRRLQVTANDVEAAVAAALKTGDFFFADMANQAGPTGNHILHQIATAGPGIVTAPQALAAQDFPDFDQALKILLRRDLIEQIDGGYRFQVELIRRWFALFANAAS